MWTVSVREIELLDFGDRASWLAGRRQGLGASDVPSLFTDADGASLGYSSAMVLWLEKTGQIAPADLTSEYVDLGNRLEPVIADLYAERTGRKIVQYGPFCVAQHETIPFLRCTPDRWITAAPDRDGRGLVQIKKSNRYVAHRWDDGVPLGIQIQVQAEMAVTGYDYDSVPVIFDLSRFVTCDVERDPVFIEVLEDRVRWFWDLVQRGEAPPMDGSEKTLDALKRLHPHDTGETVRLPEEALEWTAALEVARSHEKAACAARTLAENNIRAAIGAATFGELPDGRKLSLKTTTRKGYQPKAVEQTTFRTLRIAGSSLP